MVVGEDREDGRKKGGKTSGEFETEFKQKQLLNWSKEKTLESENKKIKKLWAW